MDVKSQQSRAAGSSAPRILGSQAGRKRPTARRRRTIQRMSVRKHQKIGRKGMGWDSGRYLS